jgi:hypothetical protein
MRVIVSPFVFRDSQTQGNQFPRYPNLNSCDVIYAIKTQQNTSAHLSVIKPAKQNTKQQTRNPSSCLKLLGNITTWHRFHAKFSAAVQTQDMFQK